MTLLLLLGLWLAGLVVVVAWRAIVTRPCRHDWQEVWRVSFVQPLRDDAVFRGFACGRCGRTDAGTPRATDDEPDYSAPDPYVVSLLEGRRDRP